MDDSAFAVDVSETWPLKNQVLAEYKSLFQVHEGDQLLELYEAEDAHMGRLFGLAYVGSLECALRLSLCDRKDK